MNEKREKINHAVVAQKIAAAHPDLVCFVGSKTRKTFWREKSESYEKPQILLLIFNHGITEREDINKIYFLLTILCDKNNR
jgi:hypothetical protein